MFFVQNQSVNRGNSTLQKLTTIIIGHKKREGFKTFPFRVFLSFKNLEFETDRST